ncbi:MAG: hypothetical protein ACLU3I_05670 [Acutalibacteraceae bacterium]
MAEFEAEVKAQDIIKELKADRLFTDTNLKTILSCGADVLLDSVKSAYVAAGHNRRTGETYRHIVRPEYRQARQAGCPVYGRHAARQTARQHL